LRNGHCGLAARCQLTVDEIEDLRIAVDEGIGAAPAATRCRARH